MPKIIIVESCKKCELGFDSKIKLNCPYKHVHKKHLPDTIHKDCPLEDYKK